MGLLLAGWEFLFVLKSPSPADASKCRWVQQHRMKTTENPTVMCREKSRPLRFCTLAGLRVERSWAILLSAGPTDPTAPIIYWSRWYDVDSNRNQHGNPVAHGTWQDSAIAALRQKNRYVIGETPTAASLLCTYTISQYQRICFVSGLWVGTLLGPHSSWTTWITTSHGWSCICICDIDIYI